MAKFLALIVIAIFVFLAIFSSATIFGSQKIHLVNIFAASSETITHGPIVGNVTDTHATIWVRAIPPPGDKYLVRVSTSLAELSQAKVGKNTRVAALTLTGPDSTYKSVFTDLSPNTTYYVNVFSGTNPKLASPTHFKTFATPGTAQPFKMVILTDFGTSSTTQNPGTAGVKTFESVTKERLPADFIFLGGDLWHTNLANGLQSEREFKTKLREMYKSIYSLNSTAGPYDDFVKFILPNYALMHVYDDHDLGYNNANKTFPWKKTTLNVLNEYFPAYQTSPNGAWQNASYGNTDFFILDVRSQRDNNNDLDDANKSMLDGDNLGDSGQLTWLLNGLKNSKATWKVIMSGSPFNPTGRKTDSWAGFKFEHQKILDFIHTNGITGVVVISGDEHMGGVDNGTNSGVPEMLVPGANLAICSTTNDPGVWSEGIYGAFGQGKNDPPCQGYGIFRVLTNPDRIVMKVNDADGKQKLSLRYFLNPSDALKYGSLLQDQ